MTGSQEEQQGSAKGGERQTLRLFGREFTLPANRATRVSLGVVLVIGGILGFLPILGFWMIPLGLLILSIDFAVVRRARRRTAVRWGRWRANGKPQGAGPTAGVGAERADTADRQRSDD